MCVCVCVCVCVYVCVLYIVDGVIVSLPHRGFFVAEREYEQNINELHL